MKMFIENKKSMIMLLIVMAISLSVCVGLFQIPYKVAAEDGIEKLCKAYTDLGIVQNYN